MNIKKLKSRLPRVTGPVLSVLLHILIIVVLLHTIGFVNRPDQPKTVFTLTEQAEIDFDEIMPLDPPEIEDDLLSPEPLTAEELSSLAPTDDLDVAPVDDSINMLDNLSPLILKNVGADLASLGTLTSRYGARAVQNGLLGSYFNRIDFTGETFMRIDETLNYHWELASPWPGRIDGELFSIIWTGRIVPPRTGTYTFYLESDDGARLWIDGELVLDQFVERERVTDEVQIPMMVGKSYDIMYAFCDVFQHAVSKLEWSCEEAGIPRQLVPTEHLWADGPSTSRMIAWNEEVRRGTAVLYPNRELMRNPAMIADKPFSHIVGYEKLDEGALVRLELDDLANDHGQFRRTGNAPAWARLPALPPSLQRAEAPVDDDDIVITIE